MADTVESYRSQRRGPLRDFVSKAVSEHLVADAPDDYDEILETVPVASGRVRVLVLLAAVVVSWALIIFIAVALCCGVSRSKPRREAPEAPYVRRDRAAAMAVWRSPVRADLGRVHVPGLVSGTRVWAGIAQV